MAMDQRLQEGDELQVLVQMKHKNAHLVLVVTDVVSKFIFDMNFNHIIYDPVRLYLRKDKKSGTLLVKGELCDVEVISIYCKTLNKFFLY